MNLYLLLVTLTIVNAGVVPDTKCDGIIIDGKYHDKETLKTGLSYPYYLAVDYTTNIMYFSYTSNRIVSKAALIDLNTKEFKDINDIPGGGALTVDQNTHDVYIGGRDGIYKYDHKNHKSELYVANNKHIWAVFFKDVLYFSEFPSGFVYTYIDGIKARFNDMEETKKTRDFVIDGEDVIFYSNDTEFCIKWTGFYSQKKGSKDVVSYDDDLLVKALTVDLHGNAYMCTPDAIFKIEKNNTKMSLEKLTDTDNCQGLAFDSNNNIIYSNRNSLFRLKINKDKTC